jgi:hypothetical protein
MLLNDNYAAPARRVDSWRSLRVCEHLDCFYLVEQLAEAALSTCQSDASEQPLLDGAPIHGWCYVDPAQSSDAAVSLVEGCPQTQQQVLRFVGDPKDGDEGVMFINCYQER